MCHDKSAARRGTILFEVVVGVTILAIAGIGWITLLAQTRAGIADMRLRESHTRKAGDLLQRYRFLSAGELDARLGTRREGNLVISVLPIAPHLYALAALDSNATTVLLITAVYARDPTQSSR